MEGLENEIRNALTLAGEQFTSFEGTIANKDIILFFGNSRGGKSSVINYLIGTNLVAFSNGLHEYKIKKVDESADGPNIGQGTLSETRIPGVHQANNSNVVYVDAPGFDDNRGEVQQIINAIFLKLIKSARTCKFVLVSDISDIQNDNVNRFLSFIKNMHGFIPSSSLRNSISLVITKIGAQWTQTEIGDLLNQQILQSGIPMEEENTALVRQFVEHNEKIALFRKPSCEGEVSDTIDVNIEGAISNCSLLRMRTIPVRPALSDEARLALLDIFQIFIDELQFLDQLNAGTAEFRNYFVVEDYVFASTEEELEETKTFLTNWKSKLMNARNTNQLNAQEILDSIIDLIQLDASTNFYKTFTLFAMLENVELIQETIRDSLIRKYKNALEIVIEKTSNLLKKINVEQKERRDLKIAFTLSAVGAGVTGVGGVLGLIAAGMRVKASISTTEAAGAVGGLKTTADVVTAVGESIRLQQDKDHQMERRSIARQSQER